MKDVKEKSVPFREPNGNIILRIIIDVNAPLLEKAAVPTYYGCMPIPSFIVILRIVLLLFFGVSAISATATLSPHLFVLPPDRLGCDAPIPYRVEASDPRFPLDSEAFRRGVFEAEAVWERGLGKDLFTYDPVGSLVIRTEFDERQKMTYEAKDLETRISIYETEAAKLDREYDATVAKFERESAAFRKSADDFNRRLAEYNDDVREWNTSGQGTIAEYEALEKRREKLEKEEKALVTTSEKIDRLAKDANDLAGKLNESAADINENIGIFKKRYGEPKPFVQGLYDPSVPSVTVFQFEDKDDLRLVLAHEFGHALGIEEHVSSEASLMYYLMGGQDIEHPGLTNEDAVAYAAACPKRVLSERETFIRYLVFTPRERMSAWDIIGIFVQR